MVKSLSFEEFQNILKLYRNRYNSSFMSHFIPLMNKACNKELTSAQLNCFIQYYRYGKSIKEIADILDVSSPTVSIHLKRARINLYKSLRYFIEPKQDFDI